MRGRLPRRGRGDGIRTKCARALAGERIALCGAARHGTGSESAAVRPGRCGPDDGRGAVEPGGKRAPVGVLDAGRRPRAHPEQVSPAGVGRLPLRGGGDSPRPGRHGWCLVSSSDMDTTRRLADHAGVPFVTLERTPGSEDTHRQVDPGVRALLPEELCVQFGMLPIGLEADAVVIASAEPVQYLPYDVAAALGGRAVSFVVVPGDQL